MERPVVSIFWTGGYDSTFRICQLSRRDVVIQPYYLSTGRDCEENEINAVRAITEKLQKDPETRAEFRSLIHIPEDSQVTDAAVLQAFSDLRKKAYMGNQYKPLAAFAKNVPGIEMSIHKDDKAIAMIQQFGALKSVTDACGENYILDSDASAPELITLFGNLRFPLVNYTKLEMKQEYEKMGLSDIIDDTWFCHHPRNGQPCGVCHPCIYTVEEGMGYRLPKAAMRRYRWQHSRTLRFARQVKHVILPKK